MAAKLPPSDAFPFLNDDVVDDDYDADNKRELWNIKRDSGNVRRNSGNIKRVSDCDDKSPFDNLGCGHPLLLGCET